MRSPLLSNDRVYFVVPKPFTSGEKTYAIGDEFPQEGARNIEMMVRARYVVPVVDNLADRPKYWYKEVKLRSVLMEKLNRENVQLKMPEPYHEPDSDEVVTLPQLTHPATTPEPEETEPDEPPPAEAVHLEQYDPSYHSTREVKEYLATVHDPEERERIIESERNGQGTEGDPEVMISAFGVDHGQSAGAIQEKAFNRKNLRVAGKAGKTPDDRGRACSTGWRPSTGSGPAPRWREADRRHTRQAHGRLQGEVLLRPQAAEAGGPEKFSAFGIGTATRKSRSWSARSRH